MYSLLQLVYNLIALKSKSVGSKDSIANSDPLNLRRNLFGKEAQKLSQKQLKCSKCSTGFKADIKS